MTLLRNILPHFNCFPLSSLSMPLINVLNLNALLKYNSKTLHNAPNKVALSLNVCID